jgi:hypothetical protein
MSRRENRMEMIGAVMPAWLAWIAAAAAAVAAITAIAHILGVGTDLDPR